MYPVEFFWRAVNRFPDRVAVIHPSGSLSYAELGELVAQRAAGLRALDPAIGSSVCVGAGDHVDHLVSILAALTADKIWVPLNPRNGDPELQRIIEFVAPSITLLDESMSSRLHCAAIVCSSMAVDRKGHGKSATGGTARKSARLLSDTQAIKFTGGTTGVPKGVQQPLRAWNCNIVTQICELGLGETDRYLIAAPLTHGTSTYMLPLLAVGAAIIFPDGSKPDELLRVAATQRATMFFSPPTLILALAEVQRREDYNLSTLRYLIYGGAPMRSDQIVAPQNVFGPVVCKTYGQTEAPQICTFLPPKEASGATIESAGRPTLMTNVAILSTTGEVLSSGEQGEIAISGDLVMSGYYRAEEETRKVLLDGWLRTGDIGVLDHRGYLYLRDRIRDVIITGGFNVYPCDVEAILASHPAISECSVVGILDEKWGEAVHAAVQIRDGVPFVPSDIQRFVRQRLGPVKSPKQVHLFDVLPRSPVGKILKTAIRDEILRRDTVQ